jgi:acid stress-induced BolA-like protein IbaG/YrbA
MAKSLKERVEDALKEAVGDRGMIALEDVSEGRVGGVVLSEDFANQTPVERQDLIWSHLDKHLSPYERTRVVFILTDTPQEYEMTRRAAS